MLKVNNLPRNFHDYKYLTVRELDGELWYYGAWTHDLNKARQQADEIDGYVIPTEKVTRA